MSGNIKSGINVKNLYRKAIELFDLSFSIKNLHLRIYLCQIIKLSKLNSLGTKLKLNIYLNAHLIYLNSSDKHFKYKIIYFSKNINMDNFL